MNRRKVRIVLMILIGLNLAFIWGNSLMAGKQSSQMSGGVIAMLYRTFSFLPEGEWFHSLIRKIAHFSEFAALGLLCSGFAVLEYERVPAGILGAGLVSACIDETIQLYVPGRASSLLDVWIDTFGFAVGLVILLIGYNLSKNKRVWRKSQ